MKVNHFGLYFVVNKKYFVYFLNSVVREDDTL